MDANRRGFFIKKITWGSNGTVNHKEDHWRAKFTGIRRSGFVPRKWEYLRISHDSISSMDSLRNATTAPKWASGVWPISWFFISRMLVLKNTTLLFPFFTLVFLSLSSYFTPFHFTFYLSELNLWSNQYYIFSPSKMNFRVLDFSIKIAFLGHGEIIM